MREVEQKATWSNLMLMFRLIFSNLFKNFSKMVVQASSERMHCLYVKMYNTLTKSELILYELAVEIQIILFGFFSNVKINA